MYKKLIKKEKYSNETELMRVKSDPMSPKSDMRYGTGMFPHMNSMESVNQNAIGMGTQVKNSNMSYRDTSAIDDLFGVLQMYDLSEIYDTMKNDKLTLDDLLVADDELLKFGFFYFLYFFYFFLVFFYLILIFFFE